MLRRNFIKKSVLGLSLVTLLSKKSIASFIINPAYSIIMLTNTVGIFTQSGGTILFAITKKGVIIIDAQFPENAEHLIAEIKLKTTQNFALLINTHHHADHTAGNIAFKKYITKIVAHKNSLKNQQTAAIKSKKELGQLYPNVIYTNRWQKNYGNEKIGLHYFGIGHTNGDSFVHLKKANIVHVGDLVFNKMHPYIDKSNGANITDWIFTLNKAIIFFTDNTTFICGHAAKGFSTIIYKVDILLFIEYLTNLKIYTLAKINEGITKEEFLKTTAIPNSPEWGGDGIQRPLEAAWLEYKEGK